MLKMVEIKNLQTMIEQFKDTFPENTDWIFVEEVDTKQEVETLQVRYSDGNHVHEFCANQKDFITTCLEESDQFVLGK